jgi:hypothetical protein
MKPISEMSVKELRFGLLGPLGLLADGHVDDGLAMFDELARRLGEATREAERMRPVVEQACSDTDHWRKHGYVYSMHDLSDCCVEYERLNKEER